MPPISSESPLRQELADLSAGICKALNSPARLVLLYALQRRPHTVSELCEVIPPASRSNTSMHLAILRGQGMVGTERRGHNVVYSLRHPDVIGAIDLLRQISNEELDRRQVRKGAADHQRVGAFLISEFSLAPVQRGVLRRG